MVKLNGIAIAPMAVFCGIMNAAELYVNSRLTLNGADICIRSFAATMETGKW